MAPNVRSSQLETRTARAKLKPRRKPYSVRIAPGIRVAYRRNIEDSGTWSVICADGKGGSWLKKLALADDRENADGKLIMDYWQACDAAKKLARADVGTAHGERPATVTEAIEAYRLDLVARGKNEWNATGLLPKLSPALADKAVALLIKKNVLGFRDSLVASGIKSATVNRYMTQFIAVLNHAAELDDRITNTKAWKLAILPAARNARRVILADDKVRAIVAAGYALDPAFGRLVEVLAETGTRISQARRLTVADLLRGDRLDIPVSRKGTGQKAAEKKPVPIPPGLAAKLRAHAAGRSLDAPLLTDGEGRPWAIGCQNNLFPAVVRAAGIDRAITCYALRHSSIARQLLGGVPAAVVASNHDTSVKEIEAHYAKFITDVSDALTRRALLDTGPVLTQPRAANDSFPADSAAAG